MTHLLEAGATDHIPVAGATDHIPLAGATATRFLKALLGAAVPVIAELKPHTADGVTLMGNRDPGELVAAYQDAGAACLSVVTGHWFGGHSGLLAEVTACSRIPVLQKDFITRAGQLRAAAELGVSAILLTARLLPATTLNRLAGLALGLGLTPFIEVVNTTEIAAIDDPAGCVIAVNNKDIRDRERGPGDVHRSLRLLPAVLATGTKCPVSASGIATPATAAALLTAGYRGVLVGTSLLTARDSRAWLADLAKHAQTASAASTNTKGSQQ